MDDFAMVSMFLFLISCILSFLSIRSKSGRGQKYEKIADYVFLAGLFSLFVTTVVVGFSVAK